MKFNSTVQQRGQVMFPQWTGERVYMVPFFQKDGLPFDLVRWQPTVDAMMDGIKTDLPIYLMIDQGIVKAGNTHRRKGIHVDGYWNPGIEAHGSGGMPAREGHRHKAPPSNGHQPYRSHSYDPPKSDYPGNHGGQRGHMSGGSRNGMHTGHMSGAGDWATALFEVPEGILLASTVTAARGLSGEFEGQIGEGGDCSHIDLSDLKPVIMEMGKVYAGNVTMLHESLPVGINCARTLVRLNVPGWHP